MSKNKIIPAALLTLAATLTLTACGAKEEKSAAPAPIKVKTLAVGTSSSDGDYRYSGTVEAERATPLSFPLGGTVTQLTVQVGDRVRRGQVIATVDPTTAQEGLAAARATLEQAEDAYRRMSHLYEAGTLAEIKWVEAQTALAQARSAERIAEKSLSDCRLLAPHDGVVSVRHLEVGQNAAPGLPVVTLSDTRSLCVRISVPEGEIASLPVGAAARIHVPALGEGALEGRVTEKGIMADPAARSYGVKISLAAAPTALLPGMVAKVSVASAVRPATAADAPIVVPARLVGLGDDNTRFVWVAECGRAVRRRVTCGALTAAGVEIVSGLFAGEHVIMEGSQKVSDGTRVTEK